MSSILSFFSLIFDRSTQLNKLTYQTTALIICLVLIPQDMTDLSLIG